MSNKTNEEKLRILQERLAQIKQKRDTSAALKKQQEKAAQVDLAEIDDIQKEKNPISFKWGKYFILSFCIVFGASYAFNNINFNALESEKSDTIEIVLGEKKLEFNLDFEGQNNIAIISTFEQESSAKAMVNDLTIKGFKANYFYLPNKSNSTKEVYKVYIGPYENEEESNQWIKNLQVDFEIITF